MNEMPITDVVLDQIWLIVPVVLLLWAVRSPWLKGVLGEARVRWILHNGLDRDTYTVFHNVTLTTRDGTTQIDHIIVSQFGVFVIETKNMGGWIYGSERDRTWTQNFYGHKYKFQNPIRQNYKHLKAVQSATMLPEHTIHSVVVFTGRCNFKTAVPPGVVTTKTLLARIKSKPFHVMTLEDKNRAVECLSNSRLPSTFRTHQQHVSNLDRKADESPRAVHKHSTEPPTHAN